MGHSRPGMGEGVSITIGAVLFGLALPLGGGDLAGSSPETIRRLIQEQKYSEARDLASKLLASAERKQGPDSVEAAAAIELLLEARVKTGCLREPEVLSLAERAVRIREHRGATDPLGLAGALTVQADVLSEIAEREKSIAIRRRVLGLLKQRLGPRDPKVGTALYDLGRDLSGEAHATEAIDVLREALGIREAALGPRAPLVAEVLETLAFALPYGEPDAKLYAQRAVGIQEGAPVSERTDLASALCTLGIVLNREGDFVEARGLHERALALYEKQFGPEDVRISRVLINLARTFQDRGENAEARRILERLLQIREDCLGPDHPRTSVILNNLGIIYMETGNYAMAREALERALAIRRSKLREGHPWIAHTLNNLGFVLLEQGDLPGARRALEESLAIREKQSAKREIAQALSNLAEVLSAMGEYPSARRHLERALELQTSVWGPEHSDVGLTRIGLGSLFLETGDYEKAVLSLTQAVVMVKKTVGPAAPQLPDALSRLALAHRMAGRAGLAIESAIEAETVARRQFRDTTQTFSEKEALQYASVRVSGLDVALSVLADSAARLPADAVDRVFDQVVRSRALVLDEMATRRPNYLKEGPPDLEKLAQELQNARERLAKLALVDAAGSADDVRRAREAAEGAERRLAERSKTFRQRMSRFQVGSKEVYSSLPRNAALVAYSRYNRPAAKAGRSDVASAYLAFVLRGGESRPVVVSLGDAGRIEELVGRWHASVVKAPPPLPAAAREAEENYREAGANLRRGVWDPVASVLGRPELLFVVPDGALHQLSFAILPSREGRYLAEDGPRIHYLSAERDLIASAGAGTRGRGLLALGDPDFEVSPLPSGSARPISATESASLSHLVRPIHSQKPSCEELRARSFSRLPGTREEAGEIASLWTTQAGGIASKGDVLLLTGSKAAESAFKSEAPGRRFIHIATHGFFAPETCGSTLRSGAAAGIRESPLLHSGLALAGANQRERVDPYSEQEDGILTAQEIASLDLSMAEWVVLSGCETGVGHIQEGEGVLGLRRAFEVAGAGTLIMSLWEVRDEAAREWMQELYKARLGGLSTADAVQQAHRSTLAARRLQGRTTHPYYWGPFVAVGDWR